MQPSPLTGQHCSAPFDIPGIDMCRVLSGVKSLGGGDLHICIYVKGFFEDSGQEWAIEKYSDVMGGGGGVRGEGGIYMYVES